MGWRRPRSGRRRRSIWPSISLAVSRPLKRPSSESRSLLVPRAQSPPCRRLQRLYAPIAEAITVRTTIPAEARSKGDKPRLEWVTIFLKNPKNVGQSRIPISPLPEAMGLSPNLLKNRPSDRDALVPRPLAAPLSESYTPFAGPVAIAHQPLSAPPEYTPEAY